MNDSPKSEKEIAFVQGNDSSSSIQGQDANQNAYNQNTANNNTNNAMRDEQKQAALLLSGEFESLYQETKIMIKQKQFKKVISLLEQYRPEKGLSISQKILVNRRMIVSSNKILKLYSYDVDIESEDKIMQLLERTVRLLSESYRFLNLYICKILPNLLNDAFLNDASHLTSDDENDRFPIKRIKSAFESLHSYDVYMKEKDEKSSGGKSRETQEEKTYKLGSDRFNQPLTDDKIYKMINERYNQPLDSNSLIIYFKFYKELVVIQLKYFYMNNIVGYELDQYIIQLLQYFLRVSNIYKRNHKYKLSFFYLKEANRIVDEVSCYQFIHKKSFQFINLKKNPEIIHLCSKIRLTISNFYYEASRIQLAIDYTENAIFLMQFEYRLRICDKQPNSQISKKENGRQMNCIKTIIIAFINLSLFYEAINDYRRLYETCQLSEFIAQKFLKGLDEVKKYMGKIFSEVCKRYENYLTELGELDLIARQILWKEANNLSKQWDETTQKEEDKFVQQFNDKFYEKFKIRDLNQVLKVKTKKHEKKYILVEHLDKTKFNQIEGERLKKRMIQEKMKEKMREQSSDNDNLDEYDETDEIRQHMSMEQMFSSDLGQSPYNRDNSSSPTWSQVQNMNMGFLQKNILTTESSGKNRQNSDDKNQGTFKSPKSQSIQFQKLDNIKEVSQDEDILKHDLDGDSKSIAKDTKQTSSQSQSNFNEKQTNISQSDDQNKTQNDVSFFDLGASFFQNSNFEENWKSQLKSSIQQISETNSVQNKQTTTNPDKKQQSSSAQKYVAKDWRTLKQKPPAIKQHPIEYKSKVLTSTDYFNPYIRQVTPKKALKTIIDESIERYQKLLRYPRNAQEFNVKFLEEHIRNIVADKVEQDKIKDMLQANEHFGVLFSRDEMDKKRMDFAKKIVHLKILRDLNPKLKDYYNDLYYEHKLEIERNGEFQMLLSDNIRELERIKQFKKERNVDLVIDKGLNVDLTDEMTKALESKLQQKKKKKNLRESIFKHKDNQIFGEAKNLKTVFQSYLGQLREIERNERLKKEQQERDKHKEEEMKYIEQQKQILINQDSQEQISIQQTKVIAKQPIQEQQQQPTSANTSQAHYQQFQHLQSQIINTSQAVPNTPKSSASILKQLQANQLPKKSQYQSVPGRLEKILTFHQEEERKSQKDIDSALKSKTQTLKEMRNKDIRIRGSKSIQHSDQQVVKDIIDQYQDQESLNKCIKRVPMYKITHRNSLYDMNLCKFDKNQHNDELDRQKRYHEEKQKQQKEQENRMMYYGSPNMLQASEPEMQLKSSLEEFSKTLKEGNFTRTEQRKKLQFEEIKQKEKLLLEKQQQMLQQQYNNFNQIFIPLGETQSATKQKKSPKKQKDNLHQFQTALLTPTSFDPYKQFNSSDPTKRPEFFKQCSNKVIKLVATDVERNLKDTYEEHLKIKYKVDKKKDYIEELNFGRKQQFDIHFNKQIVCQYIQQKLKYNKKQLIQNLILQRFASQYCELRQSTFQASDQMIQVEKPKNLLDITKMKMKQNKKKIDES